MFDKGANDIARTLRKTIWSVRPKATPKQAVGGVIAPENAHQLRGPQPFSSIHDVLGDDGVEVFILGVSAMDDTAYVE